MTTKRRSPTRGGPSTHSTYPNTLNRRVRLDVFVSVNSESLTGSSGGDRDREMLLEALDGVVEMRHAGFMANQPAT